MIFYFYFSFYVLKKWWGFNRRLFTLKLLCQHPMLDLSFLRFACKNLISYRYYSDDTRIVYRYVWYSARNDGRKERRNCKNWQTIFARWSSIRYNWNFEPSRYAFCALFIRKIPCNRARHHLKIRDILQKPVNILGKLAILYFTNLRF